MITSAYSRAALELVRKYTPALIFCDINMPEMNGIELLARIRTLGTPCAVVMLTAQAEQDLIIKAMQLGAVDYVLKPFDLNELAESTPLYVQMGKRIQAAHIPNDSEESVRHQLRMTELFRLKNHVLKSNRKPGT